jgi:hypothetical protein
MLRDLELAVEKTAHAYETRHAALLELPESC